MVMVTPGMYLISKSRESRSSRAGASVPCAVSSSAAVALVARYLSVPGLPRVLDGRVSYAAMCLFIDF